MKRPKVNREILQQVELEDRHERELFEEAQNVLRRVENEKSNDENTKSQQRIDSY